MKNSLTLVFHRLAPPSLLLQDRHGHSERFFHRARELLHIDVLDHGSLSFVQTLLIITQYLQSTQSPSRCWNSLGFACRLGQGLGLHVEDSQTDQDPRQREIRRRIWHGCNIMDTCVFIITVRLHRLTDYRVASMTLGRPMMTHQHNLPLPSSLYDEDFATWDNPSSNEKLSLFTFYVETIKLYQLLGKVVTNVYKPWSAHATQDSSPRFTREPQNEIPTIMLLAEELSHYEQDIPEALHWRDGQQLRNKLPGVPQTIIQRQSNVLHARYVADYSLISTRSLKVSQISSCTGSPSSSIISACMS